MSSVLIVTPLIEEAEALLSALGAGGIQTAPAQVGRLGCSVVPSLDMLVAVGGHGKAQFAVQAQHLIDQCPNAKLLVCLGAAGGLTPDVDVGDVVVGTVTVEHDFKERFTPEPPPRHNADAAVLRGFTEVAAASGLAFRVHFGPIASGDEDIVEGSRATELRLATQAICVAWEGSGGARVARFNGIPFIEIRSITDSADGQAATSFSENLTQGISNAARLVLAWHAWARAAA